MTEPSIALVFTADEWVVALHRHIADHGGARVRQIVLEPALALEDEHDVLVVSHRWPDLTRGFVAALHAVHRRVLVVVDPDEPDGREHALALGADAIGDSSSKPAVLLEAIRVCAHQPRQGTASHGSTNAAWRPGPTVPAGRTVLVSGPRGSGVTEIAVALAHLMGTRDRVILVDGDVESAAVAVRLGIALEPNLRTGIDAVQHGRFDPLEAVQTSPGVACGLVAGFPTRGAVGHASSRDVVELVEGLTRRGRWVVVDGSGLSGEGESNSGALRSALVRGADAVVVVGAATPVGVTRVLAWCAQESALATCRVHLALNQAPRDRFRRGEIESEISRTIRSDTVTHVPFDRAVCAAAWQGTPVPRGDFVKAMTALCHHVGPARAANVAPGEKLPAAGDQRRTV